MVRSLGKTTSALSMTAPEVVRMKFSTLRKLGGFTIVELMTAVVVVGVVATMAVPKMEKAYERMRFRSAVRDVNSTLRLARSYSLSSKGQYAVQFGTSPCTVTLFKDKVNLSSYSFDSGDSLVRVDTLPSEFTWVGTDCTNNVLAFTPSGSAAFSGGGNVYSLAYDDNIIAFHSTTVLPSTGRVSYSMYYY
jgi:prepilin-type N-terminal cleavage/methylation domain-containing protein